MNRASHQTIHGDPFLVDFSTQCKGIRGNVWTTISTDSSNRMKFMYPRRPILLNEIKLKIRPNVHSTYKLENIRVIARFAARLICLSTPLSHKKNF